MRFVIVGHGVASTTFGRFAAERDPSIEIDVYGDEPYLYYPRPKLIDLVAGRVEPAAMPQYPQEWYQKRSIHLHLGQSISSIFPGAHQIVLQDGTVVGYDRLLLANGASSFIPPLQGASLNGVLALRTLQNALDLKAYAQTAQNTVILGGGLLGLDLAMALRENNTAVTVIEMMPRLLPRQLDVEGARVLTDILTRKGLQIIVDDQCTEIKGSTRPEQIVLKSGRMIPAQLVAVSAGVRPNIQIAQAAGLACNHGIVVDAYMRTSERDIYAIGDVAEYNQHVWGIIPVALAQAKAAAASMCGDMSAPYQPVVPSTTLKVTGIDLTSIGEVNPEAAGYREVRTQDEARGIYKKIVIRENRVVGAILLGDRTSVRAISNLIEKGTDVGSYVDKLLNPAFNIASLG